MWPTDHWGWGKQDRYNETWMWHDVPFAMRKLDTPWTPNMTSGLNVPLASRRVGSAAARVKFWAAGALMLLVEILVVAALLA